ncbi:MAG: biotin/lipoyl-containing protein, partial [Selenomonas noxia]
SIDAPMPGKIIEVKVSVGQAVKAGDTLLILEAMKMQNEIAAPSDGTVKSISVSAGQSVKVRDQLVVLG